MLYDVLNGFYLVNGNRILLETEEVTNEDRVDFLVYQTGVLLEFLIRTRTRSQLQGGNGLGVPRMTDTVFAPMELSEVRQECCVCVVMSIGCLMQHDGVFGYLLQSDTANGADFCTEVSLQQTLRETDALEDLRTTITADGRDTHLRHNFK